MFTTKKQRKNGVVMLPARPSISETLKRIPQGGEAVFRFRDLSPSSGAVRACATRLNNSGRYGRFSVQTDYARELYVIRRTAAHL